MCQLLKEKIDDLKTKKHYLKIFSIVYNNNDNYIENKSGIYLDLNKLKPTTIELINKDINSIEYEPLINIDALKISFDALDESIVPKNYRNVLKKMRRKNI